ncbi:MAG: type II secretion system protein [Planctomycetota bacterium]|jgi:prepilin-type N-terminal cleavage/methylation domain-containing protein/prepilin-type processing-associated H-X9-DG protein
MRAPRAFTLLELIITIGLILVLAGLLVPAIGGVRRSGRTAACLANLRSLNLAHAAYQTDHRGFFVDVGLPHGGAGNEEIAWFNTLRDYYGNELAARSPIDTSPHWRSEVGGEGVPIPPSKDDFRRTSYGFNQFLSRTVSPHVGVEGVAGATDRLTRVLAPQSTVSFMLMVFEGENAGTDHPHFEQYWFFPNPDIYLSEVPKWVETNAVRGPRNSWGSVSNYAFLDGHVDSKEFAEVLLDSEMNQFDPRASRNFTARRATAGGG